MRRRVMLGIAIALIVLLAAGLAIAGAAAAERPSFCPTCHEMRPFHDAWQKGAHAGTSCIDCHVDPGLGARFQHKVYAARELRRHFTQDTRFPLAKPLTVPNKRCERCHTDLASTETTVHGQHRVAVEKCVDCHFGTGHEVSSEALVAAGLFNKKVERKRYTGEWASVDKGVANLPTHKPTTCIECHNMAATPCTACHTPPHENRGECNRCHAIDEPFSFEHPGVEARCTDCHLPPGDHFAADCIVCHKKPGTNWKWKHPATGDKHPPTRTLMCPDCHPNGLTQWSCTCHGGPKPKPAPAPAPAPAPSLPTTKTPRSNPATGQ